MSLVQNYYNTGTVTVANGSPNVLGSGSSWATVIRAGDIFCAQGLAVRILAVTDNLNIVLSDNWPGTSITAGSYEIRIPSPAADLTASIRVLLEGLDGGPLTGLSSLSYANGDFLQYNGTLGQLTNISLAATMGVIAGSLQFNAGTISTPGITFNGDTNTGIFHPSADVMAFVAGGSQWAQVSSAGLGIRSTGAAFDVNLSSSEVLTASRTLALVMGDATRTLTFGGNLTTAGGDITLTATASTNITLPTTGTLVTRTATETLTNKTISAASNTISNLDTTMYASGVFSTDNTLSANSATIIPSQSAVKGYVDGLVQGLAWKRPVQCVATTNITLSGEQTIDGQTTSASRVLAIGQTTGANNGIYVSGSGAWTRATDADAATELVYAAVLVEAGTLHAGTVYTCTNTSITLGTTSLTFVQSGVSTNTLTAGTGLNLTGSTLSIASNGVTYALFQTMVANSLHGNPTGSTATSQAITLGATLAFSSGVLQTAAFTGDVTATANSFATTVAKIQSTTVSGTTGSGNVVFDTSPNFTGPVGIGMTPTNVLDITKTQNAGSIVKLINASTGTAASAQFQLGNSTHTAAISMYGTGYTTSGLAMQDSLRIDSGAAANGLIFSCGASTQMRWGFNSTENMRLGYTGVLYVGDTASNYGTINNQSAVVAGSFQSFAGTVSGSGSGPGNLQTMFTLPSGGEFTYLVSCYIGANDASYNQVAIIVYDGTSGTGANLIPYTAAGPSPAVFRTTMGVSGLNVVLYQSGTSGAWTYHWTALRIA